MVIIILFTHDLLEKETSQRGDHSERKSRDGWRQLDFSAIPVSISAVSLTSRQTWQNVNSKRRLQRIQNVQEGKRHKKKEISSCFCLCSFCFLGEVSNSWILMTSAETSCWEIGRNSQMCLLRNFTCRSTFLYVWMPHPSCHIHRSEGSVLLLQHLQTKGLQCKPLEGTSVQVHTQRIWEVPNFSTMNAAEFKTDQISQIS